MSQATIFCGSRPAGRARPRYCFPAATLSNENPWRCPSGSTNGSITRSTPEIASQLLGSSIAAHTLATGAVATDECWKVWLGTAAT